METTDFLFIYRSIEAMMRIHLLKFKCIAILCAGIAVSAPTLTHADWSIKTINADSMTTAFAINDSGQVIGGNWSSNNYSDIFRSFITGPNGVGINRIGSDDGDFFVSGINALGLVVGDYQLKSDDSYHSFVTEPNGVGIIELASIKVGATNTPDINDSGQIILNITSYDSETGEPHLNAYIKNPDSPHLTSISMSNSATFFSANAINASGQVVGYVGERDGVTGSGLTGANGVGFTNLGTLGGNVTFSQDINIHGQVVGQSDLSQQINQQPHRGFVTGPNGENLMDLGSFGGGYYSSLSAALAINDSGEVIGIFSTDAGQHYSSFLYSHGGMTNLSLLDVVIQNGWSDISVKDINNNGQIVGDGFHNNHREVFLLSYTPDTIFNPVPIFIPDPNFNPPPPPPVPEPQTYLMMLAGCMMIWLTLKKRVRQRSLTI